MASPPGATQRAEWRRAEHDSQRGLGRRPAVRAGAGPAHGPALQGRVLLGHAQMRAVLCYCRRIVIYRPTLFHIIANPHGMTASEGSDRSCGEQHRPCLGTPRVLHIDDGPATLFRMYFHRCAHAIVSDCLRLDVHVLLVENLRLWTPSLSFCRYSPAGKWADCGQSHYQRRVGGWPELRARRWSEN